MKKVIFFFFLFILPFTANAQTVDVYLFYGAECAYCHQEREFLNILQKQYQDNINIYEYEVWHNEENSELLETVREVMNDKGQGVPFTVIGSESITGYMNDTPAVIQSLINQNLKNNETNIVTSILRDVKITVTDNEELIIPLMGNVNVTKVPMLFITFALALADTVNVNSLFIILFLTAILLIMNRGKKLFLGPFLLTMAFMYILLIFNIFNCNSIFLTAFRTIIALIPIGIAAIILSKISKKIEKKDLNKLETFITNHQKIFISISSIILGFIMGLLFYNTADGYPNILHIALDISDQNIHLYFTLYILIFIIIIYLIALLLSKILSKFISNKYLGSFIILMVIGTILIFLPNLFMFTS